jgi:3-(3-hydroxy-phenyl)propionate hydroxylase
LSKAIGVQAGTLDCLEHAFDSAFVQKMIQAGQIAHEVNIHLNDGEAIRVSLDSIASKHAYILILPQSETERLLEEKVNAEGVSVERQTEFISVQETGDQLVSKLKLPSGEMVDHVSPWILGADGSHSAVRSSVAIPFQGQTYQADFILGDVEVEWPWAHGSIRTFLNERGVIAAFPMGGLHCRLILIPQTASPAKQAREISREEFQSIVSELSQNKITIKSATWLTRFSVHHRLVQHFQKERVFLAGDAAHIHSPAGGQGMNTGIQDALNLCLKIKKVMNGEAPSTLLADYEKERLPVAKKIVHGTDFFTKMVIASSSPAVNWFRQHLAPKIVSNRWVQKRMVAAISQAKIAQQEIARY